VEATLERTLRQTWAFMFRGYHLTRRYLSWVIVFNFYALTGSAAVALIGVAANDHQLSLTLVVGVLLWNFLSILYNEIAMSVGYERWEGTLEYTFMAPVPRLVHLVGLSLFALCNSVVNTAVVLLGLMLFTDLSLAGANLVGVVVVLLASTMAFVGRLLSGGGTAGLAAADLGSITGDLHAGGLSPAHRRRESGHVVPATGGRPTVGRDPGA
jgi:ABC-2 type transport system permease protein